MALTNTTRLVLCKVNNVDTNISLSLLQRSIHPFATSMLFEDSLSHNHPALAFRHASEQFPEFFFIKSRLAVVVELHQDFSLGRAAL